MDYNLEIIKSEYIQGSFKKNTNLDKEVVENVTNISGDVELGIAKNSEGEENLAIKLLLEVKVISDKDRKEIAIAKNEYIFIFKLEDSELSYKIINSDLKEDELLNLTNELVNMGYITIKEYIENIFKRADINITLPIKIKLT
ncbi:TPA: hypothetical protein ACGFBC_002177 [Clostridium perfringens]|nr:hypothetical protein [Clostridium perfringens]MDH5076734.1 hypothetical protein [Clostridium perfringens]MDM0633750.1 hypothetical protein [Clostridium perfringens]MDO6234130.1 hypothetical protein [Clostridium perfringens]WDT39115.1 hypothetical protein PVA22_12970 [Clostridium perfringens]